MKLLNVKYERKKYEIALNNFDIGNPKSGNEFSIIIGKNATGKSKLIGNIANTFRSLNSRRTGKNLEDVIKIEYLLNGRYITYTNKEIHNINKSELPRKVIAISNSLYDKFPLTRSSDKGFYQYVGARDSGLDNERHTIYSLIDTIQENCFDRKFIEQALNVFTFLGLDSKIYIDLKTNHSEDSKVFQTLFSGKLSAEKIKEDILGLSRLNRLSNEHQNKLKELLDSDEYIKGLIKFLKENRANILNTEHTPGQSFLINLYQPKALAIFHENFQYFTFLRKLNILAYNKILISKKGGKKYNILGSSSGEIAILTSFIRTLPHLESNSLVLVDEPEISLHPNWQIEYMNKLAELLNNYENCHIVIATHSPYILSDSRPDNSFLVKINPNGSVVQEESPFCRSVEDILWNVFEVPTTRNYYLASELGDILKFLSKSEKNENEKAEMATRFSKLKDLVNDRLKEEDPIKKVFKIVEKRI